jgi:NAD(P)-dependent dehydrogenase (short-subunit alcohol dehydrogenase family)
MACAEAGMAVVVADIDAAGAERVAEAIRAQKGRALARVTDVSDAKAVDALADAAWEEFGGCHLLCNNAGVMVRGSIEESSDADWEWVFGVNLYGVLNGIRSFVPRMKEQGEPAHIVNTASIAGLTALPFLTVYSASKYAVVAVSEGLSHELADSPIGVSVLCPGGVDTLITQSERNRPAALGGDGIVGNATVAEEAGKADAGEGMQEVLQPRDVATLVLEAVKAGDLYVPTHPAWRAAAQARADAIAAAYDKTATRRAAI